MTTDEANKIARLIGFADRGCNNCVRDLTEHANRIFPEFIWTTVDDSDMHVDTYINADNIECKDWYIHVTAEPRT